jgi:hypothetical protein
MEEPKRADTDRGIAFQGNYERRESRAQRTRIPRSPSMESVCEDREPGQRFGARPRDCGRESWERRAGRERERGLVRGRGARHEGSRGGGRGAERKMARRDTTG